MTLNNSLVSGYPTLAGQQAKESQLAIYRSFGALQARVVLYLQAELHKLEQNLKTFKDNLSMFKNGFEAFFFYS